MNPDDAKRLDDMLLKRRKEIGARVTAEEEYDQMKGELAQFTSYARAVVVALALAALLVAAAFFTVFGIMGGFKASRGSQPPAVHLDEQRSVDAWPRSSSSTTTRPVIPRLRRRIFV